MSRRKTKKFTDKLEDAYYNKKGRPGELAVLRHLEIAGCSEIVDHESNRELQLRGIDISYVNEWGNPATIQVKENYVIEPPVVKGAPEPRYFYIENHNDPKNIRCVEADLMIHVNMDTLAFVVYSTKLMIDAVEQHNQAKDESEMIGQYHLARGVRLIRISDDKFDWFTRGFLLTSPED